MMWKPSDIAVENFIQMSSLFSFADQTKLPLGPKPLDSILRLLKRFIRELTFPLGSPFEIPFSCIVIKADSEEECIG